MTYTTFPLFSMFSVRKASTLIVTESERDADRGKERERVSRFAMNLQGN